MSWFKSFINWITPPPKEVDEVAPDLARHRHQRGIGSVDHPGEPDPVHHAIEQEQAVQQQEPPQRSVGDHQRREGEAVECRLVGSVGR